MSNTTVGKAWAWSYSALKNFETCPKRYENYNVTKAVVEPESQQLAQGHALHEMFAARLGQGTPLPFGFAVFEPMLARLKAAPGTLAVEQKLAINERFQPTTFFASDAWMRTVIDAAVVAGDHATILDWKDGKVKEDTTQLALMALVTFIHAPAVDKVRAALVFVNHNHTESTTYWRVDQAKLWADVLPRVRALRLAVDTSDYPAKPSGLCKKYCAVNTCPYYRRGTG